VTPDLSADLTDDAFLCGRLRLWQPRAGYRAATDPVLLAACVPARMGDRVLDLGCGAGAAALCLAARVPGLHLAGLEVQPPYADLARRNGARNGIALDVHEGRVEEMPAALRVDFDHVIANPPYYPTGGTPSPDAGRATALQVDTPVEEWVSAGLRRLRPGGWLTMIVATALMPVALTVQGNATALPLTAREGRAPARVILQWRKSSRAPFRLLAPFVTHDGPAHTGDREGYTPAANAVLRDGADLLAHFR
jgi:tRNA1Val (adenine37-N6)-methyltransferase